MAVFDWKDVEGLNALVAKMTRNGAAERSVNLLRSLSVKIGTELVAEDSMKSQKLTVKDVARSFGHRLKRLRELSGMTQQEVADKLGVSKNSIYLYEKGINQPTFEKLVNLCILMEANPNYLLGWEQRGGIRDALEDLSEAMRGESEEG